MRQAMLQPNAAASLPSDATRAVGLDGGRWGKCAATARSGNCGLSDFIIGQSLAEAFRPQNGRGVSISCFAINQPERGEPRRTWWL